MKFKFEVEIWHQILKFKFVVGLWSLSLKLRFKIKVWKFYHLLKLLVWAPLQNIEWISSKMRKISGFEFSEKSLKLWISIKDWLVIQRNKFYSVERMGQHLYSFNSCILYTWVSLEALNNLFELPLHTPKIPSLWFDL